MKSEPIERIRILIECEDLSRNDLAMKTEIPYDRWQAVINKRTKLRHDEIEALGKLYPEYKHWLAFGEELPEAGQISPMTKEQMKKLETLKKVSE